MPNSKKVSIGIVVIALIGFYILNLTRNPDLTLMATAFWIVCGLFAWFVPEDHDIQMYVADFNDIVFYVMIGPLHWMVIVVVYACRILDTGSFKFKAMP